MSEEQPPLANTLRRTRLQTASSHNLSPLESLQTRGRGRGTPSPVARRSLNSAPPFVTAPGGQVNTPEEFEDASDEYDMPLTEPISVEDLQRIAKTASDAAKAAADALTAMTAQMQATTNANTELRATKRPGLPPFDQKNVEIWIRRTQSAFTRAGVTTTKDKFAFLEPLFPVNMDPKINEFLFGPLTPDPWQPFLAYIKEEYGRTIDQKVATVINGVRRDGRRPSQLAATIADLTQGVTLEDVLKEQFLRELPNDVRRQIVKDAKGLSLQETAKLADEYFDREGKPLFTTPTSAINAVEAETARPSQGPTHNPRTGNGLATSSTPAASGFTVAFEPESDVSHINRKPPRPPAKGNSSARNPSSSNIRFPEGVKFDEQGFCWFHANFGAKATKCTAGCAYGKTGNGKQGPRK